MKKLFVCLFATALMLSVTGPVSVNPPTALAATLPPASGATSPAPPNGSFTQPAVVVSGAANYGFENGLTDWSTSGWATVQPGGASGNYLYLSGASAISQPFNVQPGATTFSYYVNTSVPGGAYSKLWVAPGPAYTAWAQLDAVLSATNGWQLRTISFAGYVNQSVKVQYKGVLGAAGFDEGALFDQVPGWTEPASALSIPSVAMPATNPSTGTFLYCKGAAAGPAVTPAAQLWGNPGTMMSEEFTVSSTGEPLYFRAAGSGVGPAYQIGIFTEVDNFSAVTVLISGVLSNGASFFTACDVSQWAGKRAKIRLQAVSPGSIFFSAGGVTFGAKPNSQSSDDPVQFATGIDTHEHTDLAIPGKGIPLSFTRQYVSTGTPKQGRLGWGWTDNFDTQLTEFSGGSVLVQRSDGSTSYYKNNGGVLSPPPGDFSTLVKNGDGTYTLTTQDRVQMGYDASGRLTSMADRNGNTTSLAYNGAGQLASVTDPGGRALTFTYEPGGSAINTPAPQLAFTNADFEAGTYAGWTPAGTSFGTAPTTRAIATWVSGVQGTYFASSYVSGSSQSDAFTGTLVSQAFTAGKQVVFLLEGGTTVSTLHVSLVLPDLTEVLLTANQTNSAALLPITFDTTPYEGQSVQLKVLDNATGSWGQLSIDNVQVLTTPTGTYAPPLGVPTSPFYNSDVEQNSWANWFLTGTAFGRRPATDQPGGRQGWYYISSRVVNDAATGSITSAPFTAGTSMSFKLAGGNFPSTVYAALVLGDGTEVLKTAPTSAADMLSVTLNTTDYAGQTVRFRLVDNQTATNGFIRADALTVTYNARLKAVSDGLGRSVVYGYDDATNDLTSVTNVGGGTSAFTYSGHRLVTIKDALNHVQVTNTYDTANRVAEQRDALNNLTCFYYGAPPAYTSANCPGTTPAPQAGETVMVDARGNRWRYQHDKAFRTTGVEDPLGNAAVYTYEATGALCSPANRGNLCSVNDQLGHITSFTYDANGNVLTRTDADNKTWTYTYDSFNNVLTAIDPLTRTTTNVYNASGNLTSVTNALSQTTTYTPSADGTLASVTDPLNHTTSFTYDTKGNLLTATDALSHATTNTWDLGGRLLTSTDPLGHTTTSTYDALNNVLTVTDALNHATTYTYDAKGQRTTATDANNKTTTYGYDVAGRLLTVTDPLSQTVTYGYDANGNRTTMTNTRGKTTAYAYDAANRLTSETDPLSGATAYGYDAGGRRTSRTDAISQTTLYSYDVVDRLTTIDYPAGTPDVAYTYDPVGNQLTMVDGTGTTAYTRDAVYRPTSIQDGAGNTVGYGYDAAGRRTSITYPGGTETVAYSYDSANRLASVTDWLSRVTGYTYDDADRLTSTTLGNGLISDRTYDNGDRLASLVNRNGGVTLSSYAYTLDNVGNRSQVVDTTGTTSLTYDGLYRLTGVTYPNADTQSYTYDAQGNRLTKVHNGTPTSYSYDDADQMTLAGGVAYTYDADGNQTAAGADTFSWDAENRMTASTIGGVNGSYAYDGAGLRRSRTLGGATVTYTWDLTGSLANVLRDSAGNRYVYGLDLISRTDGGGAQEYYLTDGLGSTTGLADGAGSVTDTYGYDVYGAVRARTGTSGQEFTFTGEQVDSSGLQYLRARYYDAASGRFVSRDSLL